MYTLRPISARVGRIREKYRETKPEFCTARYRLITEFYMNNPDLTGILKRAKNFRNICENIAIRIDEDEVIVGAQSSKYRACALYPENSVIWLKEELKSGLMMTRDIDPYIVSDLDRDYILSTVDFWMKECMSAKTDAAIIDEYFPVAKNGACMFGPRGQTMSPVGHFCTGYDTAIRKGFAAIRAEARAEKGRARGAGAARLHDRAVQFLPRRLHCLRRHDHADKALFEACCRKSGRGEKSCPQKRAGDHGGRSSTGAWKSRAGRSTRPSSASLCTRPACAWTPTCTA